MKYFTIEELCKTNHKDIQNIPNDIQKNNLIILINECLDKIRENYGGPINVSSGFRCDKLNKIVGGSSTSQHCKGQAADLKCSDNKKLIQLIEKLGLYDQLIYEYGTDTQPDWVHVSYNKEHNRHQKLRKYSNDPKYYIITSTWNIKNK